MAEIELVVMKKEFGYHDEIIILATLKVSDYQDSDAKIKILLQQKSSISKWMRLYKPIACDRLFRGSKTSLSFGRRTESDHPVESI